MNTSFWEEVWVGSVPLKFRFPRLFKLSEDKKGRVGKFGKWEGGVWAWELRWRRGLRGREVSYFNQLTEVISDVVPCLGKKNGWRWKAAKDVTFSTSSAYETIAKEKREEVASSAAELAKVWNAPTIHKARVTAWRSLRNRLATCDNLLKRKIQIADDERWCNACAMAEDSVEHVLLHCPKTEQVWNNLQQWINIKTAKPKGLSQHFLSFIYSSKGKRCRKFLKTLWIGTIWILWRCRNESRFQGKVWEIQKVSQEIKGRMWSWNSIFHIVDTSIPFPLWCSKDFTLDFL
ncbi:uncharacterized protein LOC131008461 [Salvia miltiorrhiza]|uniref:uncharacterized protein LOC131008461 n=1 Tax=Salvia miltiorrhiza TaxID=226208 RepID=UPI0025AD2BB4|nr:uncharacterized protein LOC131008461 [Salvia miltiorrhiza]